MVPELNQSVEDASRVRTWCVLLSLYWHWPHAPPGERQGGAGHLQPPEPGHSGGHRLSVHAGQIPGRYCHQPLMKNLQLRFKVLCFVKSLSLDYNVNLIIQVDYKIHGSTSPVARENSTLVPCSEYSNFFLWASVYINLGHNGENWIFTTRQVTDYRLTQRR